MDSSYSFFPAFFSSCLLLPSSCLWSHSEGLLTRSFTHSLRLSCLLTQLWNLLLERTDSCLIISENHVHHFIEWLELIFLSWTAKFGVTLVVHDDIMFSCVFKRDKLRRDERGSDEVQVKCKLACFFASP